jgi:fatty acyl-CoA reductase
MILICVQLFVKLKDEQPKFRHQIVAVAGDCSQPNLGMSSQDRAAIIREVSIVFHVAATVRFDEKLKLAVPINVRSTRDILNLCKEITNIKVHSNAFPNNSKVHLRRSKRNFFIFI